jgi:uncharacterized membrane protein YsdA (DUF1294 family)
VRELLTLPWIGTLSVLSFLLMGFDKGRARAGGRRVPERVLLLVAALGGAPGAVLGMYVFHHKTRHPRFQYGLPALLLAQAGLVFWFR